MTDDYPGTVSRAPASAAGYPGTPATPPKPRGAQPTSAPVPVTVGGNAKAAGSGLLGSLLGLTPSGMQATGAEIGGHIADWGLRHLGVPQRVVDQSAEWQRQMRPATPTDIQQASHTYHAPQNDTEQWASVAGSMLPNAFMGPEGITARVAAVVLPTVGSEGSRRVVQSAGGGQDAQAAASFLGGLAGGGAAGFRRAPRVAVTPGEAGVNVFAQRTKPNLLQMRQRADEYRASGIEPTIADVTDESGRGMIRAGASRMTPGRQVAQDFGDRRALDLPDRVGQQARRTMSADPRTPDQIAAEIAANRKKAGDEQYGAVRNEPFAMPEKTVSALRTDHGREAIREAVRRERDPVVRAALNRLAGDALDAPNTPITVGMADGISRVLKGRAQAAERAGDNSLASFLGGLADDVRNPAMQAHPGYADAVGNYATESRAIEATKKGEDFLKRNTDEFVSDVSRMTPDEVELARATGRRAVERASGESVSAAPGVARKLAEAPEQRARNAALLGPDAPAFEQGMRLEERAVQNARDIAPRTGSQTQSRAQDALDATHAGVKLAGKAARGDFIGGALDAAHMWLKSRGLNDAQAEALVRLTTDPTQTGTVLRQLEGAVGRRPAREFIGQFRAQLIRAGKAPATIGSGMLSATSAPERRPRQGRH